MISKRKFYRTVIRVEVLSEEPFEYNDLSDIAAAIEDECSGTYETVKSEVLTAKQAVAALLKQGSDPEFFLLTDTGEDLDDE